MKINRSVVTALVAILMIGLWFLVNSGKHDDDASKPKVPGPFEAQQGNVITVIAERRIASKHQIKYKLYGRTEANREVSVKAETPGIVVSTPVAEGRFVKKGAIICRQDIDARKAVLDQANALLKTRELEYQAAQKLVEKGYRSATQAATALAALDGARASVKQAAIELDNVNMRAPFGGIFEQQIAEIGDYLAPGQPCGLLVELDPLIVTSQLTENQIKNINVGQTADISLATGENLTGTVQFIESRSDPSTRTFKAEIKVPNTDFSLKAGVTATVRFSAGLVNAQHIPSQILSLDDQGRLGVRFLDSENRVYFTEVTTIDEDDKGIWVTGLPDETRIIVKGHEYVSAGTVVSTSTDTRSVSGAQN